MQRAREHAKSGHRRRISDDDLPEIHAPGLRPQRQGSSALGGEFDHVRRQSRERVQIRYYSRTNEPFSSLLSAQKRSFSRERSLIFVRAGGLAAAVPGELAGYWEAHQRFGKLPWADLFEPSVELCEKGYTLTPVQYDGFSYNKNNIYNDPTLR